MKRAFIFTFVVAAVIVDSNSVAGVANDIPSCYAANKLQVPIVEREIFVFIDQTTPLDSGLTKSVIENVGRLVVPGTAIVVGSFSSFSQGKYFEIITAGTLEPAFPVKSRSEIGVKILQSFDSCLRDQLAFGQRMVLAALNKAIADGNPNLNRSDIMASLKQLSGRVSESGSKDKIVFLVSDMLENSSISSFYANRNIRMLDPGVELKAAEKAQQIGNFSGARVFVLGGGLLQEQNVGKGKDSGAYRDPKALSALREFWSMYFSKSNARLLEFGTPALSNPVR